MSTKDKAIALHEQGWNCCQSVLGSVCEELGLDSKTAYELAAFFGGGMRRGEVCGAVTGALMALGLEHGDENNRRKLDSIKFMAEFSNKFGSCVCRELLGPPGTSKKDFCPVLIAYAAEYLEAHRNNENKEKEEQL